MTLGTLARLRLKLGDAQGALELARGAIDMATEIGYPNDKSAYRLIEGDANLVLGSLDAAAEAYEAAKAGAEGKYVVDAAAGLADVAMARGDNGTALELVKPILETAIAGGIAMIADPLRAYLSFHAVLRAVHDARAHPLLAAARGLLSEVMAKIDDPAALETFTAREDVAALLA
jgi:tetratricopeptide (TPR) repeat protein